MNETQPKLSLRNLLSYGVGDFYGGGTFFIIGLLYLFFMTDVVGLPPKIAGLIFIVGKLWDAFLDPLIGYISDHSRSRYGRRRIFFLAGLVPAGLSFALLWLPINTHVLGVKFAYYLASFLFFTTTFAALMIPYSALGAELHPDDGERNRVTGFRIFFSQLSVIVGGTVPKIIIESFPEPHQGHFMMGVFFGALFMLPWMVVFMGTRESRVHKQAKHSPKEFFLSFGSVFRNRTFLRHLGMYLCAYTAMDLVMAILRYFLRYVLNMEEHMTLALGTLLVAQIIALPVYVWMAGKIGKGRTFAIGLTIWVSAMLPTGLLPSTVHVGVLIALCAIIGTGLSAGVLIPWAILPNVGDVDELITGQKRIGLYSGVMTFARKLVQAIAIFGLSIALDSSGYVAGVAQSESTIFSLRMIYIIAPTLFLIAGIVLGIRFGITPSTQPIIAAELARLRKGGRREDVSPETRSFCEKIIGSDYLKLPQF
jgi:oligogalacturonide transporter